MKASFASILALIPLLSGCSHFMPPVAGVSAVSSSHSVPWTPPKPGKTDSGPLTPVPDAVRDRMRRLTIADAVNLALENDPDTRAAWLTARSAAAAWAGTLGSLWLPDLSLNAAATRLWSFPDGFNGRDARDSLTVYRAEAGLSFLLFDFGARASYTAMAREALLAADWTHNQAIQNAVLETETAFFNYCASRSLLEANRTSLAEAEEHLRVAEEKHRVGLATLADVLQARTAHSEVRLAVLATEGQVRITRGGLADAMGYPAHAFQDIGAVDPGPPIPGVAQTVDSLVNLALAARPDLQAVRAAGHAASAAADAALSRMLPTLSIAGAASRTRMEGISRHMDDASGRLVLQIPLFSGFSRQAEWAAARASAESALERARSAEQSVILQVVAARSDWLTAEGRLQAAEDLVAAAGQSEAVAAGRYREGAGSMLDLLTAQRALASARAEQINARLGWFTALARLSHAAGVLEQSGAVSPEPEASPLEVKP
ncbi:TolC family protein [bacterium]|nr:TolC family protein [bacterium]